MVDVKVLGLRSIFGIDVLMLRLRFWGRGFEVQVSRSKS